MRLLQIAAFVNELNLKNVIAFFTSAYVRKTALNKEPLFSISALVCFILNNGKDNMGKFDPKSNEGIHIEYALNGHAYLVYNRRLLTIVESMHVVFDESDNYMPKPVTYELKLDDLRTVLHKNDLIDINAKDSHVFK